MRLSPFHLALPVSDLHRARKFYGDFLACPEGRSADDWVDFNFFGHQLVCHLNTDHVPPRPDHNPVDGHDVPIPHFGVVLEMPDWQQLADKLIAAKVQFIIAPHLRFKGQPGEQATLFFLDPFGHALEFKAFADIQSELFKKTPTEQNIMQTEPPETTLALQTERLEICPLLLQHAPALLAYRSDERVTQFQSFRPQSLADAEAFIANTAKKYNQADSWSQLGIFLSDHLIGDIGVHFIGSQEIELGYTIAPAQQRQGFATEALQDLISHLFQDLQKHRIRATLSPENAASIALLKRLGFRQEAYFKQAYWNGQHWEDEVLFALLNTEWPGQVSTK